MLRMGKWQLGLFDKHISNVCLSYFHIRALRHIRLFSETSKTIACAIVSSRLDYVNSILTGISSHKIHHLQRVQNSLAWVVTRSTANTTSALNSRHWLPIQQFGLGSFWVKKRANMAMKSRRLKCAYESWNVCQKCHQIDWRSLPVKQMYPQPWWKFDWKVIVVVGWCQSKLPQF